MTVARLGALDCPTTRQVINLAASMSPANTWTPALEGATIRNLYPGRSAFQGILAVDLAHAGFTALRDAPSDVYGTILADRFEPAVAVDGLGEAKYRIEENYFKFYACCRYNHFALDAIAAMRRAHAFSSEEVAAVHVTTIPFGLRMADADPASMLAAKFSVPHAVAATLVLGHAGLGAFDATALADPRIRDLARRVEVTAIPRWARAHRLPARASDRAPGWTGARGDGTIVPRRRAESGAARGRRKFLALASPCALRARAPALTPLTTRRIRERPRPGGALRLSERRPYFVIARSSTALVARASRAGGCAKGPSRQLALPDQKPQPPAQLRSSLFGKTGKLSTTLPTARASRVRTCSTPPRRQTISSTLAGNEEIAWCAGSRSRAWRRSRWRRDREVTSPRRVFDARF